jgi:hypothetical protein
LTIVSLGLLLVSFSNVKEDIDPNPVTLTFVDHLKAGLIEQDVYVEKKQGSGKVYRVQPTEKDIYLEKELYSAREANHHDPFDVGSTGPVAMGRPLGMKLSKWLSAKGTATYVCDAGWGKLKASFENLVPNATYTMWHFFMSAPPTVPFNGTLDVPLGDRDGSQSVFKTDARGRAVLDITFEHCLQFSDNQLVSALAIAYHSDGQTYGGSPGPFGKATHVQLFAMLPNVDDLQ